MVAKAEHGSSKRIRLVNVSCQRAADVTQARALMADSARAAVLTDDAHDADALFDHIESKGVTAIIPRNEIGKYNATSTATRFAIAM